MLSYSGARGKSTKRDRWVLTTLRIATLMVVVACLFRPMLLLSAAVPQRNYVGVLIDDSRSMQIADRDGKPRSDWVEHEFGGPDSTILKALRQKFIVRLFRFSSSAQRIDSAADVHFASNETHVGAAIEQARQELDAVPAFWPRRSVRWRRHFAHRNRRRVAGTPREIDSGIHRRTRRRSI